MIGGVHTQNCIVTGFYGWGGRLMFGKKCFCFGRDQIVQVSRRIRLKVVNTFLAEFQGIALLISKCFLPKPKPSTITTSQFE